MSTNLQILYCLLSHPRIIALCPHRWQVGRVKLKVFGVSHQAVVKPGSPLSIPVHRLYRSHSARGSLVIRGSWVTVTCQETAHHRYATLFKSQTLRTDQSLFQGQKLLMYSPRILWNEASVFSLRHSRALRSVGMIWLVRVSLRVLMLWPSLFMYQRDVKSQPDSAPELRFIHSCSFWSEGRWEGGGPETQQMSNSNAVLLDAFLASTRCERILQAASEQHVCFNLVRFKGKE